MNSLLQGNKRDQKSLPGSKSTENIKTCTKLTNTHKPSPKRKEKTKRIDDDESANESSFSSNSSIFRP